MESVSDPSPLKVTEPPSTIIPAVILSLPAPPLIIVTDQLLLPLLLSKCQPLGQSNCLTCSVGHSYCNSSSHNRKINSRDVIRRSQCQRCSTSKSHVVNNIRCYYGHNVCSCTLAVDCNGTIDTETTVAVTPPAVPPMFTVTASVACQFYDS